MHAMPRGENEQQGNVTGHLEKVRLVRRINFNQIQ